MKKDFFGRKAAVGALCACLAVLGVPAAALAQGDDPASASLVQDNDLGTALAQDGSGAGAAFGQGDGSSAGALDGTEPTGSAAVPLRASDEANALSGSSAPSASNSVTVTSWTELKAEVEKPDGAANVLIGGPLVADATIEVRRAVFVSSADGGPFAVERGAGFKKALLSVGQDGDLELRNVVLDGRMDEVGDSDESLAIVDSGHLTLGAGAELKNNQRAGDGASNGFGGGVNVRGEDSLLTMQEGSRVGGNKDTFGGGGVGVSKSGRFEMQGGSIDGNKGDSTGMSNGGGGGVKVIGAASFLMTGGSVRNNSAQSGGGVGVADASFLMTGGSVEGNAAGSSCGGVNVTAGASFVMKGGSVEGNVTDGSVGGGVGLFLNASFVMEGGAVVGNEIRGGGSDAVGGGGVYAIDDARFEMKKGAVVRGNKAPSAGGGVFVSGGASFSMEGGSVEGNELGRFSAGEALFIGEEATKDVDIKGGLLSSDKGSTVCVRSSSVSFKLSGGILTSGFVAILSYADVADKVAVGGTGMLFSQGADVVYEGKSISVPDPSENGLIVLKTPGSAPYARGFSTDLKVKPATGKATWDEEAGIGGVRYENGSNQGFLPLGVEVREPLKPTVTTASLPDAVKGEAYDQVLSADGLPQSVWSVSKGALPDGLSLDWWSGRIHGTPSATGAFAFTVTASNGAGPDAAADLSIDVCVHRTLTDPATGVSVSGLLTDDAELKVTKGGLHPVETCTACDEMREREALGTPLAEFDVSLSKGFGKGDMEVSIPVGSAYDGRTVSLLHCAGSSLESVEAKVSGGTATGTFASLSPFAVVAPKDAVPLPSSDPRALAKTGDGADAVSWTVLAAVSLLAVAGSLGGRRRRSGNESR